MSLYSRHELGVTVLHKRKHLEYNIPSYRTNVCCNRLSNQIHRQMKRQSRPLSLCHRHHHHHQTNKLNKSKKAFHYNIFQSVKLFFYLSLLYCLIFFSKVLWIWIKSNHSTKRVTKPFVGKIAHALNHYQYHLTATVINYT